MAKKTKTRRKANKANEIGMPNEDEMVRYEAEHQVSRAFMETPEAKKLVNETARKIKQQKREIKQSVSMTAKGRKSYKKTGRKKQ